MLDFLFSRAAPGPFERVTVDLGARVVEVPVARIAGNRPGKTLVVTGGMDGDEYAGMEAAYALAERYAGGDFAGTLVIVPIVNVPGFLAECSQNPMDDTFPKLVYPGSPHGAPTERLVHWLFDGVVRGADAYLDLHGGAITERVRPFLWLFETGHPDADVLAKRYVVCADTDLAVLERAGRGSKAEALARAGCVYALAESGERGVRMEEDILRHVDWAETLMALLGMIDRPASPRPEPPVVLSAVRLIVAPHDGVWRLAALDDVVAKGSLIGTHMRLDGSGETTVTAPLEGVPLWWKETMAMRKGDVLCALGV